MRFLVVILVILFVAAGYLYWRLRPYIRMARQVFRAARGSGVFKVGGEPGEMPAGRGDGDARTAEPLVKCATCETWLPASRAIRPGKSGAAYCSHACLERAAEGGRRPHRSAS